MVNPNLTHPKDKLIGLALFIIGLIAYVYTLAPTLLDGDAALFQYAPYTLAVTYPTGFPMYLLLAKLWLVIFPFGEIAWRMNLFSAVMGSLTLPVLYGVGRRVWRNRSAALASVFIYAAIRTYWRWSTEAKGYTLNILLFSLVLWLALLEDAEDPLLNGERPTFARQIKHRLITWRWYIGAFIFGMGVAGHNTTILLLPGVLLLYWFNFQAARAKRNGANRKQLSTPRWLLTSGILFAIPMLAYLYIPLRAEWLLARYGREAAIAHGLLADFYNSGFNGLIRYFTAADFTGGVVSNWGSLPAQFSSVYLPILHEEFTLTGVLLGVAGGLTLAWRRARLFWPLFLLYAIPIPFVLTYGRGEQFAFLLTSDLIFALFAGGSVVLAGLAARHWGGDKRAKLTVELGALALIILFQAVPQARYSVNRLVNKWDTSTYDYWTDVLNHPLDENAGLMAKWGDLTSLWYLQLVEGNRSDLLGVYPETETVAADWLGAGRTLYIAGPSLDAWEAGVMERYQLVPWGRLVRLAPQTVDPASLLPQLAQPQNAVFGAQVRLLGAEFTPAVASNETLYVQLSWEALADLPGDATYSLRLVQGDNKATQKDDTLLSGWFPLDYLPAEQYFVGAYPVEIPPGTLPGSYNLYLAVYQKDGGAWPLEDGQPVLNLGQVEVTFAPAESRPGANRFGGRFSLDDYEFSVSRVGQGKGFSLQMLWRALIPPQDNYVPGEEIHTLLVELVDSQGAVWRAWRQPVNVSGWRANQQIRFQQNVTIPAEAPTDEDSLQLRISWLTPDGSRLPVRRGLLPAGDGLELDSPTTLPKKNRTFEKPASQHELFVNFEDKAALVGYTLPETIAAGQTLPVQLVWQGIGEMRHSYKVFIHLLDEQGNIVSQQDKFPGEREKQPTTSWAAGEYITDPIDMLLPADFPPGGYSVVVGLYLPPTGSRLPRFDETGQVMGDSFALGTIEVHP